MPSPAHRPVRFARLPWRAGLLLLAVTAAAGYLRAAEEPLTQATSVLALPSDVASQKLRVVLSGVVVAAEPDWEGKFFLQDASGGIFVVGTDRQPAVGDSVTVEGVSNRGAFAPIVAQARWRITGTAPLPAARPTVAERLMAGAEDGQRIEFTGRVRSTYFVPSRKLAVDVAISGQRVHVFPKLPPGLNPESLVGATVRVRGTVAASFNATLRQLTSINVYVPTAADFAVEQPEAHPPFAQPVVPLGEIARYRPDLNRGERMHVRGVVTFHRPGLDLYLQDATGGLHLESIQVNRLAPGDTVEAVGFLDIAGYRPVLEDARCRRLELNSSPVAPHEPPFAELRAGQHAAELVLLRGRLIGRTVRPVRRDLAGFVGVRTICTIQNPDLTFTAECEHNPENSTLADLALGSTVAVTGVAEIETGDDGQLKTLALLQRTPDDLRVLATPSWFTAPRLLTGLIVVCALALAVVGWSVTVSKKNAMLSFLVAEREKAQRELQQAHDQLEQRVHERTEQLKVEMTARKSAEVEFKATLAERTRLARELHDTLEQALTGIALQLDTTAKLLARAPADAGRHLELARGFMRQSQLELRRSIWDLRSRELEQFDLAQALRQLGEQIARGTQLRVEFEVDGPARPLPEVVEENLLRIGQEALTNVVKHSGATLATVRLGFAADAVTLAVRDNGSGLQPDKVAAPSEQHFGLLGMAERAKRLGGRFTVVGAPGEGTTITVSLPLAAAAPGTPSVV